METTETFWEATSLNDVVIKKEESSATKILKILVGHLLGSRQDHEPDSLNLTSVLQMFDQLTEVERQVLHNATATRSKEELIHFLNLQIMQPRQFEVSLMEFQEYRIQKILHLYIPPILILLGTFGNLFSFIVLRRKPMIKVSSYLYLAVLAVIDTLVLYNGLLRIWMVELMSFDYQGSGNWICKLTVAFGYVSSDLSVWLIIAVTVERYIVVCFPFHASSMCNVSRARKVILGLLLLMLSLNVHFMWTAEIVEEEGESICRGGDQFRQLVEEIWPWVDTLIYSFLPFVTITILNVLIIREVAGAHSSRLRMTASESDTTTTSYLTSCTGSRRANTCEGTRLTALLLTVSFTFLLLTLPNNIALIVSRFWNQKYEGTSDQLSFEERRVAVHGLAQFKLITTITELLMYTNHSINFFLYCATGNKFRQQILELLRCLQRHPQLQSQAEQSWGSHSMRRTSQSVLSSEMTQAVLPSRRKNSCTSNVELDKNDENEQFLNRHHNVSLNKKSNFASKVKNTSIKVLSISFIDSYSSSNKQEFGCDHLHSTLDNLGECFSTQCHQSPKSNNNDTCPDKNHVYNLETYYKCSSENSQEKSSTDLQEINVNNYHICLTDNSQEAGMNSCQEIFSENYVEKSSRVNKESASSNNHKALIENNSKEPFEDYHRTSPMNYKFQRGSSLRACFMDRTNESRCVRYELCPNVDLDNKNQHPISFRDNIPTCKMYQCQTSQSYFSSPKRGIFPTSSRLNSRDKKYFLLKPALRLCNIATMYLYDRSNRSLSRD